MSRGVYWVWEEHLCKRLICEMLISLLSFLFDLQFVFSMMQRFHHLSFATVVCWLILFFVDWNFFSRPVASPRMFFFVSSPLKGEVSLFFETFYFCRLVAYPIIISLFTFTVPSVWDHFFCVSMSTTRTSLLIFSWVLQCHLISSSFAFLRNCLWSIGLCLKTYVSSYLKHKCCFPWFFAILSKLPAAG